MSRGRVIAAVVVLAVVAAVVGIVMYSASARVPEVAVAKVEKEDLTQVVSASGNVESDLKADVYPPTQGTIKTIFVVDGQPVKAGQALAVMDTAPLQLQVEQARAQLRSAKAQLDQIDMQKASEEDVEAARAALRAAQAAEEAAHDAYVAAVRARGGTPAGSGGTDGPDLGLEATGGAGSGSGAAAPTPEQLLVQWRQAQAGVEQAEAAVLRAENGRKVAAQKSAARAAVTAAEEALALAQDTVTKATLTAPIDGVVLFGSGSGGPIGSAGGGAAAAAAAGGGAGKVTAGSAVSPAAPVFSVVQLGTVNFNAQVDEADVSKVAVGMNAEVTLDAFPGQTFASKVVAVKTQAVQTSTGGTAFPVLIALHATGKRLLLGMGGNTDIQVSGIKDAVTVPVEALFDDNGTNYVFVVTNNKVERRKVKTGILTDTRAQILEGAEPGETVAVGGLSNLKDGMTVRVKP